MKVISYIDCLNRGGMEALISDIATNIKKNDFEFYIVSGLGGDLEKEIENSNAKYYKLNRRKSIDFKLIRQLRKIIITEKIDIIHSHNDISAFYGFVSSFGLKVKRVNTYHGHIHENKEKIIFKFLVNRAELNLSVSESFIKELSKELNVNKIEVLYNGIDNKKFSTINNRNALREINVCDSDYIIGMVGNFTSVKDHWTLCRAVPLVLGKNSNVKFLFVGARDETNKGLFDRCIKFCEENDLMKNVFFLGKRNDIPEILNSLDLFILSSVTDTFGIAVVEAMFSKVPCLVSDISPLKEISDNGKYTKLFRSGDHESLSAEILKCIENNEELNSIKENAFNWATSMFSISTHISNLNNIYKRVLETK